MGLGRGFGGLLIFLRLRLSEGKAQCIEKSLPVFVVVCGSHKNDIKAEVALDLIEFHFRKDGLIGDARGIVPPSKVFFEFPKRF